MKKYSETCYRLPWSEEDNPNGWIEPTTYCQLKCPGCYRGLDQDDFLPSHVELDELKRQIDWLLENRNIQTLSIAGGDPLLYPNLKELLDYAVGKGLRPMIYTNGIALDEDLLTELKESGVVQIIVHIDRFQVRKGRKLSEIDVEELKSHFCAMFRKIRGINLGFIQPLSGDCLQNLDTMIRFFNSNRDIINLVVFTLYREICWLHDKKPEINMDISMDDVISQLTKSGNFQSAAYLPGLINTDEPSWMFSFSIGNSKYIFGFINGNIYNKLQERYYKKAGRHMFISRNHVVKISGLLKLIQYKSIRKILWKVVLNMFSANSRNFFQTMLILRGPVKIGNEWDLCDGCPDAILKGSSLVPSCILNELS